MRIARGVKTKIGIVDHVNKEARGEFERDLLGGTQRTTSVSWKCGMLPCGM
jgi:hypothetical protein